MKFDELIREGRDTDALRLMARPADRGRSREMSRNDLERALSALGRIPVERIEEMCDAERDGRLVVLPCKVGDTVYMLYPKGILETRITEIFIISKISFSTFNINKHGIPNYHGFFEDDIGKTVFLTRAEAALKGANR